MAEYGSWHTGRRLLSESWLVRYRYELRSPGLRSVNRSAFDDPNVRDETIATSSDSLDEPRARRRITQRIANSVDRFVYAVVEIDEGLGGPQSIAKLFSRNCLAWPFEKHRQDPKRLLLKSEPHAVLP